MSTVHQRSANSNSQDHEVFFKEKIYDETAYAFTDSFDNFKILSIFLYFYSFPNPFNFVKSHK